MIERIIEFSANNRLLVFTITAIACMMGIWSIRTMPLDAIPDLSDTQVIVYTRWDRSPEIVEDQVTYPIVTAMLGAPKVKAVRGFSDFGYSYVYVVFEDGTDMYWARSRTLEYLAGTAASLPIDVHPTLGPDATAIGWIFQYVLSDTSGKHGPADLRSIQDWYIRYHLKSVPGVAEVASLGGFVKQYQVNVDPNRLQAYGIPISRVTEAVRGSNTEASGRLLEFGGTEYMIRGRGYAKSVADLENTVLSASEDGSPIRVKDIGQVTVGPDIRRGVADLDGRSDPVSGIVIMRHDQNALDVIQRVKQRIHEIEPSLPVGVHITPVYDRSDLIRRSISTMNWTLIEVIATVSLVVFLFLQHIPSALIPIVTIPITVLISFIPFRGIGMTANIMSLAGIAIAIGALVDASIVVVEQVHKKLELWERSGRVGNYRSVVIGAMKEVAPPSFFALLVIGFSFLPVLALESVEGRMFRPLAYTKILAMLVAAILAITLDPALRITLTHLRRFDFRPLWLVRSANAVLVGRIHSEERHPLSRFLIRAYEPVCEWALSNKWIVIATAATLLIITIPVAVNLGSEFMPPLDEGSLLYMPSTMPGISIAEAQKLLQVTDRILKRFPEVDQVLGKAGRAETATDPAPLSMLETVITLKPQSQWPRIRTWYSSWSPEWLKTVLRHITPDHLGMQALVDEMNRAVTLPGISNAWTMPVKGRIEMLTTGMRTAVGLKISGDDEAKIQNVGVQIEAALKSVRGTRSVFSERTGDGYFLDIVWNRDELARYGITVEQAQVAVTNAIGGDNVTTTVEGRARYPVNVRYMRDFRSDPDALRRVLISADDGQRLIPLGQLAELKVATGPSMIRDEDGMLTGYVYIDSSGRDLRSYVREAQRTLERSLSLPAGVSIRWSGQWEAMGRVQRRLMVALPITLGLVFVLLYMNMRSMTKTLIVALAVPFSAIGAVWFLYALGYNMSVAVWVGIIALLGVDAETGVFMLLYLDLAYEEARRDGRLGTIRELRQAIIAGAVKRIRPKAMTTATMFVGLIPIMWSTGSGSDVMKRIAAPMIGGISTSFILELIVYPVIYQFWRSRSLRWRARAQRQSEVAAVEAS